MKTIGGCQKFDGGGGGSGWRKMVEGDRGRHFLGRQCVCFLTESIEEEDVIGTSVGVAGRGEREKMFGLCCGSWWVRERESVRAIEKERGGYGMSR